MRGGASRQCVPRRSLGTRANDQNPARLAEPHAPQGAVRAVVGRRRLRGRADVRRGRVLQRLARFHRRPHRPLRRRPRHRQQGQDDAASLGRRPTPAARPSPRRARRRRRVAALPRRRPLHLAERAERTRPAAGASASSASIPTTRRWTCRSLQPRRPTCDCPIGPCSTGRRAPSTAGRTWRVAATSWPAGALTSAGTFRIGTDFVYEGNAVVGESGSPISSRPAPARPCATSRSAWSASSPGPIRPRSSNA